MISPQQVPEKIRVSVGSAIVLGLLKGILDAPPTTIYMLTYHEGKCLANCSFCPQARSSTSRADMLARVTWPLFQMEEVIPRICSSAQKGEIKRVCLQAINYPEVFRDVLHVTEVIHSQCNVPISLSCQPLSKPQMRELMRAGADRISIALDAATEYIFDIVKGSSTHSPYNWSRHNLALKRAVEVFGKHQVSTHLVVGLGETEREIIETIQRCINLGVLPSLFSFTPISGTKLQEQHQPSLETYRRVQIARYLIVHKRTRYEEMRFDAEGRILYFGLDKRQLRNTVLEGKPFQTSGCPGCNRPYYNERPGGPMYNYPRPLSSDELREIESHLQI